MKPGVSTTTISGIPNELQSRHEPRRLLRAVGVEHAAEVARLVGDDRRPGGPSIRANAVTMLRAQRGAQLEQRARVDDPAERVAHVVDPARLGRARPRPGRRSPAAPARRERQRLAGALTAGRRAGRARAAAALGSSGSTRWQTPLRSCTRGPPSSAGVDLLAERLARPRRARSGTSRRPRSSRSSRSAPASRRRRRPRRRETTEICGTTPGQRDRAGGRSARSRRAPRCPPACARRRTRRTPTTGIRARSASLEHADDRVGVRARRASRRGRTPSCA